VGAPVIQACLNGRRTRAEHPNIPLTPDELTLEARAAVSAGARGLHVHPRGADGAETHDAAAVGATVRALRAACPGIETSVTTGFWITGDVERRRALIAAWSELPDAASVNIGEPGAAELCAMLAGRGVAVEIGIASVAETHALIQSGAAAHGARVLIEVEGDANDALVEIAAIDTLLDHAGITLPRLDHGYGRATWAILDRAFRLGHDLRIGFEDTLTLPNGRPAKSNGELVATFLARQEAR
jgi:uncharacterized protein (DUF849 family)